MAMPSCPRGHIGAHIVRGGRYGAAGRRRQLFVCRSPAGTHRFADWLPRQVLATQANCVECLTDLDPEEGPPYPRGYEFPARLIAHALVEVAHGTSYRAAAEWVRAHHRTKQGKRGQATVAYGANGTLVGDWVEALAPAIWDAHGRTSWPEVVAVDELPFKGASRTTGPWPHRGKVKGGRDLFMILGAQGYPSGERSRPWFFMPAPSKKAIHWVEFFRALDGRPRAIIGDPASQWQYAARQVWPAPDTPELLISEFHLARLIEKHLVPRRIAEGDPLIDLGRHAFRGVAEWEALMAAFSATGNYNLDRFVTKYGVRIATQIANHPRSPTQPADVPLSTGGLEATFRRELTRRLRDRRGVFTNRERLARLLSLTTLDMLGEADERAWAQTIRQWLLSRRGQPPRTRQITDPGRTSSLRFGGTR